MKKILKNCSRVLSVLLSVALILGTTPLEFVSAAEPDTGTIELKIDDVKVTSDSSVEFKDTEVIGAKKTLTISVVDSLGNDVTSVANIIFDENYDRNIVSINDNELKSVGVGKTTVTVYADYTQGGNSGQATTSFDVKVFQKVELSLDVEDVVGESILTKKKVKIIVKDCPEALKEKLKINYTMGGNPVELTQFTESEKGLESGEIELTPGTYNFVPEVDVTDTYYTFNGENKNKEYTVVQGDSGFDVKDETENGVEEVYYSESVTYTLKADVKGIFEVTSDDATVGTYQLEEYDPSTNTKGIGVTVTFNTVKDQENDPAKIKFKFTPSDNNYAESTVTKEVIVNKIPVTAVWPSQTTFEKTYDGKTSYKTNVSPTLSCEINGIQINTSIINELYTGDFSLNSANAGNNITATYNGTLVISDKDHYTLSNPKPEIIVNVLPILLTADDVNVGVGKDKQYDGTSTAEFEEVPTVKKDNLVESDKEKGFTLVYTADYVYVDEDEEGHVVKGKSTEDTEALNIRITNLKVIDGGNESKNYVFNNETSVNCDGTYSITKALTFKDFTDITLNEPDNNGVYWFGEEITKDEYQFAQVVIDENGNETYGEWKNNYLPSETDTLVSASKVDNGKRKISQPLKVAYTSKASTAVIAAKIDDKLITMEDAYNSYASITKDSIIEVVLQITDISPSGINKIEWYSSSDAIEKNDSSTWPTENINVITEITDDAFQLEKVNKESELKEFYYARIEDRTGKYTYVSSEGVLQDVVAPSVTLTTPEADGTYTFDGDNKSINVYSDSTIELQVDLAENKPSELSEFLVASGIAEVKLVLINSKNEEKTYTITDDIWSGDKLTYIKELKKAEKPSESQVANAIGNISLKATLKDLNDGKYLAKISAEDKAGNVSAISTFEFIISKNNPTVQITDNRKSNAGAQKNMYIGGTYAISISGLFNKSNIKEQIKFNSNALDETFISGALDENTGLPIYTVEFDFGEKRNLQNPSKEGEYTLSSEELADCLARKPETIINEKFQIDATDPTYTIEFSKPNSNSVFVDNKYYYNNDIKATIKITEDGSYDDSLINIAVSKKGEQESVLSWNKGTKYSSNENDYLIDYDSVNKTFTLTVKAKPDNHSTDNDGYRFTLEGTDKAGNTYSITLDDATENPMKFDYVMDTTAPELTKIEYISDKPFNTVNGKDYIASVPKVKLQVQEHNPNTECNSNLDSTIKETIKWEQTGDSLTAYVEVPMRGQYGDEQKLSYTIIDRAGNLAVLPEKNDNNKTVQFIKDIMEYSGTRSESEANMTNVELLGGKYTDVFTVDTIAPVITYDYDRTPDKENVDGVDYFKLKDAEGNINPLAVTIEIEEHNFDKSLLQVAISGYTENSVISETDWEKKDDTFTKRIVLKDESEYTILSSGTDCAGNKIALKKKEHVSASDNNNGEAKLIVAIDTNNPSVGDHAKPLIVISPDAPAGETSDKQPLYNSGITYKVEVYDPVVNKYCSGIDEIEFSVSADDGSTASGSLKNGIIEANGMTIEAVKLDNLAKGAENAYDFRVSLDTSHFNSNGIVLSVKAVDMATNDASAKTEKVAIDVTPPKVTISYDNNDVLNEKYFKAPRTATIEVTERNFSNECCKFTVNGADVGLNFTLTNVSQGNRDNDVWTATYTFDQNGDYAVNCIVTDLANNTGEDAVFTGMAPKNFTIDLLKPIVSITFDNNDVANQMYYKAIRTATIRVEEHNFRTTDLVVAGTASNDGTTIAYPALSAWSSSGDTHTATITYSADGMYTLDVKYVDLAGNEAESPESQKFVIDTVAPELEIYDIENMSANNGVVMPGIRYSDINYDASNSDIQMKGFNNGIVQMNGDITTSRKGVDIKLHDFEHIPDMDDLYTMEVTVYDLAGNSSEDKVTFSVNRFGSTYTFDDLTNALVGANGKYYTNVEQQLVIYETNVDSLEFKEITCNLNGDLKTLIEGTDYTVEQSGSDVSWKQYTYTLKEDNFVNEGNYIITIYSEDRATNTSNNSTKGKKIEFIVDKTKPSVLISGVENEKQYRAHNKEVTLDVQDNVLLSKIVVDLNGELTEYAAEQIEAVNGKITFNVDSMNSWQTMTVKAYDAAGNENVTDEMTFLITSNIFIQYINNKAAVATSVVVVVVAGAIGFIPVVFKRKKRII